MIFTPEHIDQITRGEKTQTRRIVNSGERGLFSDEINEFMVLFANGRLKWQTGKDYAVSPGRGLPCVLWRPDDKYNPALFYALGRDGIWNPSEWVSYGEGVSAKDITRDVLVEFGYRPLRIRITEIRREPLQDISEKGAKAEGWPHGDVYGTTERVVMPSGESAVWHKGTSPVLWYARLWDSINTRKGTRWNDNPLVWALTFEAVRG